MVCGGFGLEGSAVVCLEKNASMFVEACSTLVEFSKAADAIGEDVEEAEFETT